MGVNSRANAAPSRPVTMATTIGDLLVAAADRAPTATALVTGSQRSTYAELLEQAQLSARALQTVGVQPGDRVGMLIHDPAVFAPTLFGIAMCAAVAVPINTRFRATELAHVVTNSSTDLLVVQESPDVRPSLTERLAQALPGLARSDGNASLSLLTAPSLRHVVCAGPEAPRWAVPAAQLEEAARRVDPTDLENARAQVRVRDIGLLLYTSGTSAQPKGVPITHEAMTRTAQALVTEKFQMTIRDRVWMPLPMSHIAPIAVLLGTVSHAATFLTDATYDAGRALEQIERESATIIYPAFATIALALVGHADFSSRELSSIRLILNVGGAGFLEEFQKQLPEAIEISGFGLTELAGLVVLSDIEDSAEVRFTTCGRPLRGVQVRVVDPVDKRELPVGEPGEISIRGYCNFEGYHGLPAGTSVSEDGWFHSADLGRIDADGRLVFLGRLKDMFKVGGENVAAAEVESFLDDHPKVQIAQIVPVPDERLETVPAAFVQLEDGAAMSEAEVVEYCSAGIAGYKVPRYVRFVTEWPTSATKIQKFRLRQQLVAELGLDR
jgi:acyl-CoA synthetase (AMP-forming)/AMP-acid ligase II